MSIWLEDGLRHITPKGIDCPEGFNMWRELAAIIGTDSVIELGCGRGRLTPAFCDTQYEGRDINPKAIDRAVIDCPGYDFQLMGVKHRPARWTLLYTVLLHIDDSDLLGFIRSIDTERVLICEIMRPDLACPEGIPPAFNRSLEQYAEIMGAAGFELVNYDDYEYRYYTRTDITFAEFKRSE